MAPEEHTPASRPRGEEGLTLVELMMAAAVFAIGMVAVLSSIVGIMNNHRIIATKHQTYVELQNQIADFSDDILAWDSNPGQSVLTYNPGNVTLPNLPGSQLNLYIARPDDPDTAATDESGIFGPLPLDQAVIDAEFGGAAPERPYEVVFEGLVPTTTALSEVDRTYYRFRMAALL